MLSPGVLEVQVTRVSFGFLKIKRCYLSPIMIKVCNNSPAVAA